MVLRNVTRHPLRAAASVFGIGFAVAILMIGFVFADAIEQLIDDAVLGRRAAGRHRHFRRAAIGRRAVRARPAAGRHRGGAAADGRGARPRRAIASATWRITGVPAGCRASSASSIATATRSGCRPRASCCRRSLADVLGVGPGDAGDARSARGRAGRCARCPSPDSSTTSMGLVDLHGSRRAASADAGRRVASGALLLVDAASEAALRRR